LTTTEQAASNTLPSRARLVVAFHRLRARDGGAGRPTALAGPVGLGAPPRRPRPPRGEPRGERPHQERRPPPGLAQPDAPRAAAAAAFAGPDAGAGAAARAAPAAGAERDEAPGALQLPRRGEVPEHVVGQPQREPLGGGAGGGRRERVPRRVRARERRGRAAGLGAQRALDAADAHQLIGLLPDDPLLLRLLHVNDHRRGSRRGRGRRQLLRGRRSRQLRGRVVGRGVGVRDEVGAADGAGDVRGEPGVDAVRVEDVGALGQQAQRLVVVELAEAHRALERALAGLVRLHVGVRHGGEGLEHRRVEPALAPRARGGAVGSRARGGAARAVAVAVADVDGEEAEEEEGRDEHDDDDGHGRGEVGGVIRLSILLLPLHGREVGQQEKEEGKEAAIAP
jgi:hypothetical protein